ncbi:nucleoside phosphorylase domain-containing protein [Xylaria scruposa]|nr:nucleoside phosphorylase domain-containing protein [Xylaria scruposa]
MAQDQANDKAYETYTVAIVCAIEFEMSAVRYMLDEEHLRLPNKQGDMNRYILGQLSGHNTVVAWLPWTQGKSAAAMVATNLDRTFPSIKWRFLTGIGGGVPENHDIRLGDVVVSMPEGRHGGLVQYDLGKDIDGGFRLKGFLSAPPTELRSAVCEMKSDHRVSDNKVKQFITAMLQKGSGFDDYRRPPSKSDVLFKADYSHVLNKRTCEQCDLEHVVKRSYRDGSKIHYGLIASGDRVMRSAAKRNEEVRNLGEDVLCFEMEAAGLATEFSCLVIRGISDYADSHKNDAWQHYAAAAAAACTKEILTYLDPATPPPPAATPSSDSSGNGARVSASFSGYGIQNAGSGNFSVGRDVHIGQR